VQKSNSHYAPQPYTNQSIFKSLLNCTSEISLSRNATDREFQRLVVVVVAYCVVRVLETRFSDGKTRSLHKTFRTVL